MKRTRRLMTRLFSSVLLLKYVLFKRLVNDKVVIIENAVFDIRHELFIVFLVR